MSKPGRNDPCPCGSSKKYKQCCMVRDQDAAAAARKQAAEAEAARRQRAEAQRALQKEVYAEAMDYERACERVRELIKEGKLDEAESGARDLLAGHPDQIDGLEHLAEICEARGEKQQAAAYYRQAVAFIGDRKDYDPEFVAFLRKQADRLDPPTP